MCDLSEFKYKLLESFFTHHHELYLSMLHSDHGSCDLNPYHAEGSVWTHTMMVLSQSKTELGAICGLLHDIGKPSVRTYMKNKARFFGHESQAFFMLDDILNTVDSSVLPLSRGDRNLIKTCVALHGSFHGISQEEFEDKIKGFDLSTKLILVELLEADHNGRFKKDQKDFSLYPPLKISHSEAKDKPEIIMLIGLPGSGKSSYIKNNYSSLEILSSDDLIESLGEGVNYKEKWQYFASSKENNKILEQAFNEKCQQLVKAKESFVVDMTNLTKRGRKRFTSLKNQGFHLKAVLMGTSLNESIARNNKRVGKDIKSEVIYGMASKLTFPLFDEFDEIQLLN